jgi:UDP-N-acetylglucosamine acyltransferase
MSAPRIHPSAVVDAAAVLGEGCTVGPFAVIDAGTVLGPGCTVGPHAVFIGNVTTGANNTFHAHCVIGDSPQHLAYGGEPTRVVIGTGNTFREFSTVHRGMVGSGGETVIGDGNFFMVCSHVAHDCRVGNRTIFANGAAIGGHSEIQDGAFLSGNACVHQFCRVGRSAMLGGTSSITVDLPPFWTVRDTNTARGVNVIGMRRAGFSQDEIMGVRRLYKAINRSGLTVKAAADKAEAEDGHLPAVAEVVAFIRSSKRGIVVGRKGGSDD